MGHSRNDEDRDNLTSRMLLGIDALGSARAQWDVAVQLTLADDPRRLPEVPVTTPNQAGKGELILAADAACVEGLVAAEQQTDPTSVTAVPRYLRSYSDNFGRLMGALRDAVRTHSPAGLRDELLTAIDDAAQVPEALRLEAGHPTSSLTAERLRVDDIVAPVYDVLFHLEDEGATACTLAPIVPWGDLDDPGTSA